MNESTDELDAYRQEFLHNFEVFSDLPEDENPRFGFVEYGAQLAEYITRTDLKTPATICLNGEWGSGKTTLMRAIKRNIEKNRQAPGGVRTHCLEFNAWRAEKVDIMLQLYRKIYRWARERECCADDKVKAFAKSMSKLAADVALRKFGGITYKEAASYFEKMADPDAISTQIGGLIGTNKLVIFIDDLDRCTASNILEMLEVIKNVLSIKNLVFVVTVDVKKIERAWELRYNSNVAKLESREHVEKVFPIMFSLPQKDDDSIGDYLDHLVGLVNNKHNKLRRHLIKSLTGNPRRMKRALNAIHFAIVNCDLNLYCRP